MTSNTPRFGLSVALATPFGADGSVLHDELSAHAKWCLSNGCSSVTLFGTTGEGPSLTATERAEIFERVANSGIARENIVIGVISVTIADAVSETKNALDKGAKAVLLAPPFYFTDLQEDGVFDWYCAVLDALGDVARDILLYNIPSLTGVPISNQLIARLRAKYGAIIRGIKDSSCDWNNTESLVHAHRDIDILVGDERDLAAAVRLGGSGAIGGLANLYPDQVLDLVEGRDNAFAMDLVELIISEPVVASIKALLAHQKSDANWSRLRAPLMALSNDIQLDFIKRLGEIREKHKVD